MIAARKRRRGREGSYPPSPRTDPCVPQGLLRLCEIIAQGSSEILASA